MCTGCAVLTLCLGLCFLIWGLVPLYIYVFALLCLQGVPALVMVLINGVYIAGPITWIWDIILLPGFWGFLLLLLFPSCNSTDTDVLFFFNIQEDSRNLPASFIYFQWYLHFYLPLDLVHPAFLHSCGFPSPLLWLCPWGLSCVCLSWPFVHSAWACDLLSCLGKLHIPQKYLDFVSWAGAESGSSLQNLPPRNTGELFTPHL